MEKIATILVVDDDDMVRRLAARMLALEGYRVLEAPDGDAALRLLRQGAMHVRLVVTDLAMPGLDGRRLGERIGQCWPAIPVLYMSGYPAAHMITIGALELHWPFLQKPFTTEELQRKAHDLLARPPQ